MTYQEFDKIKEAGQQAQAYVGSILRGGFVLDGFFYFVGACRERVSVESVRELQYAPYAA